MIYLFYLLLLSCHNIETNIEVDTVYTETSEKVVLNNFVETVKDTLIEKKEYYDNGKIKRKYFVDRKGLKQGGLIIFSEITGKIIGTTMYSNNEKKGDKFIFNNEGKRLQYYCYLNDSVYSKMRKYDENEIFFAEFRMNNDTTFFGNHLTDTVVYSIKFEDLSIKPSAQKKRNKK